MQANRAVSAAPGTVACWWYPRRGGEARPHEATHNKSARKHLNELKIYHINVRGSSDRGLRAGRGRASAPPESASRAPLLRAFLAGTPRSQTQSRLITTYGHEPQVCRSEIARGCLRSLQSAPLSYHGIRFNARHG
jgi:hypothetical protein